MKQTALYRSGLAVRQNTEQRTLACARPRHSLSIGKNMPADNLSNRRCINISGSRSAAAIGARVTNDLIEAPVSSARFDTRSGRLGRLPLAQICLDLPDAETGTAPARRRCP